MSKRSLGVSLLVLWVVVVSAAILIAQLPEIRWHEHLIGMAIVLWVGLMGVWEYHFSPDQQSPKDKPGKPLNNLPFSSSIDTRTPS